MAPDVVIIGSGMGGATLAAALAPSGRKILILERGEALYPTVHDRDPQAIFRDGVFRPDEIWLDGCDRPFNPGNYYNVGGNSKFYGAVLLRYRAEDFSPIQHKGGRTPGWPISYDDLEADYVAAEQLYQVRGVPGEDPTDPPRSGGFAFPPVPDEPDIVDLRRRLQKAGLTPASLPLGVDLDRWLGAGHHPWDAHPDTCGGKMDAETIGIKTALAFPNVELMTGCRATQLLSDADGRITEIRCARGQETFTVNAPLVILSAGAVQSAALLLSSANDNCPTGLANRSDQVGRNFMNHNCSAVLALHPLRRNRAVYQKTLMINDFYLSDGAGGPPLGNVQLLGKISGPILAATSAVPEWLAGLIAARSFDFYAMSEDLPNPDSRVTVSDGQIRLDWKRSNWDAHDGLVRKLKACLKKAGFPIVFSRPFDRRTPSHQCGTARMGQDRSTSVVDTFCRAHDHPNLFVVDASVLPTSAAVNPALTIAALAIRTARHIQETEFAA
ncbi:GMC family oxidoreductase [Marivita sp. S6314]|uniref:GMC oxidoreductase n=1 Tax=Marivita sp. S6314 TaxID=2926406 RepID=UPI001FF1F464|nr:GMC family oxidoreductase [Marivita sp. S6314]MCK0149326.1 GMC family oxidoreductase [Marivita sp. S6314]